MIYPLQSFGIGDVIFTQTLVREIAAGQKVVWGVEPHFVEGLNRAYPDMTFLDKKLMNIDYARRDDYETHGMRVLPIRWADAIRQVPFAQCMRAKYDLYEKDWTRWKERAMWERSETKEKKLFNFLLLSEDKPYTLCNSFFGSDSQLRANIEVEGIEMRTIPGFSLFDWAGVIERAAAIHTVSTSIIYLLELLNLRATEIHLYPRVPIEMDFRNIDYILEQGGRKYIYHV